jgi:hypothetical protein
MYLENTGFRTDTAVLLAEALSRTIYHHGNSVSNVSAMFLPVCATSIGLKPSNLFSNPQSELTK